jgi:hypothetical protein
MLLATPEKCHKKISDMINQMNRCIAKWERSGQGEVATLNQTTMMKGRMKLLSLER